MQFPPAPCRSHHTSPLCYDSIINISIDGESHHHNKTPRRELRRKAGVLMIRTRERRQSGYLKEQGEFMVCLHWETLQIYFLNVCATRWSVVAYMWRVRTEDLTLSQRTPNMALRPLTEPLNIDQHSASSFVGYSLCSPCQLPKVWFCGPAWVFFSFKYANLI